ncbi:noggin-2-like [Macrosteles quadrilineatus]|uniref:noggin-2-like n=1 Tax=Macrosteles quadrilineatus TaxID=74068 RepID=UPI0023E3518F|nr:noggin-2-like [Macrosteles quadrilineatus]
MDVEARLVHLLRVLLLATVAASLSDHRLPLSPHDLGLRPASPEDAPPDLIEDTNRYHDPRPSELNSTLLRHKLGKNLDTSFMSVSRPRDSKEFFNHSDFLFRRNRRGRLVPVGDMPRHLKDMDFKFVRLPDGTKLRTRVSAKLKKKLQQFLWAFTSCPVSYRWKDLGLRFWPRWLKEGHCPSGKTSCSIPPGMKCRPSSTVHKTILRWHCRSPVFNNAALQPHHRLCSWIKVEYPIVTQCSCACPGQNNSYS